MTLLLAMSMALLRLSSDSVGFSQVLAEQWARPPPSRLVPAAQKLELAGNPCAKNTYAQTQEPDRTVLPKKLS